MDDKFTRPVEVEESFFGKKRRGTPGRGSVGKAIVAEVKGRKTGQVHTEITPNVTKATLQQFAGQ